jgi:hypothetical protein
VRALLWTGHVVLAAATLWTIVFDPRVFFGTGGGGGGWISFSSWFHGGSWTAFRLTLLALVLYGVVAMNGGDVRAAWRGPALALVLLGWGLARGVPHIDNGSKWARGAVGARAWLRTELALRARVRHPLGAESFAGVWRAADGTEWRFFGEPGSEPGTPRRGTAVRTLAPGAPSVGAQRAACRGIYRTAYVEGGRELIEERGLDRSPHAAAVLRRVGPEARVRVVMVGCSEEPWAADFAQVVDDELWILEPYLTYDELQRDAFVLRRR